MFKHSSSFSRPFSRLAFATAALACACFSAEAWAGETRVQMSDLNLRTANGMDALHTRIEAAAKFVCGPADSQILQMQRQFYACRGVARSDALRQVDAMIAANQIAPQIVLASSKDR